MKYQINDVELNVHDEGHGEQVLLFLHYWGGSSRTWGQVIERLQNDFRLRNGNRSEHAFNRLWPTRS